MVSRIRSLLTDTQFRRLWQRFACGRELADIAAEEGVSQSDERGLKNGFGKPVSQ